MANKKIAMRLQTPADENGVRTDIHPVTTSDEVIVNPNSEEPKTLTEKLEQISAIIIQDEQPKHSCLWAKPIRDE